MKNTLGSNNPRATFTEEQVYQIKVLLMKGTSRKDIAEMYDSKIGRINDIYNLQSWLHVEVPGFEEWVDKQKGRYITTLTPENADIVPPGAKIDVKTAHAIKTLINKRERTYSDWQAIARQFNVSDEIVYHMAKGMTWRYLVV